MALRSERKVVQMKKLIKAAAVLTAAAFWEEPVLMDIFQIL